MLSEYLQQMFYLIKLNQELRATFAEGIITAMPRERAEQLVKIVRCLTEKDIVRVRLSSSFPNRIAATELSEGNKYVIFFIQLNNILIIVKLKNFMTHIESCLDAISILLNI